jgi:hypothetical protein
MRSVSRSRWGSRECTRSRPAAPIHTRKCRRYSTRCSQICNRQIASQTFKIFRRSGRFFGFKIWSFSLRRAAISATSRLMTIAARALAYVTLPAANWSRFSSCSATSVFRQQNHTWAVKRRFPALSCLSARVTALAPFLAGLHPRTVWRSRKGYRSGGGTL